MLLLKKKKKLLNIRFPSVIKPVSLSDNLLVSTPVANKYLILSSYEKLPAGKSSAKLHFSEDNVTAYLGASVSKPSWLTQADLNNLDCDLYLAAVKAPAILA